MGNSRKNKKKQKQKVSKKRILHGGEGEVVPVATSVEADNLDVDPNKKFYNLFCDEKGEKKPDADIAKAYKKAALETHPDKNPDDREQATKDFQQLSKEHDDVKEENSTYCSSNIGGKTNLDRQMEYMNFQFDIVTDILTNPEEMDKFLGFLTSDADTSNIENVNVSNETILSMLNKDNIKETITQINESNQAQKDKLQEIENKLDTIKLDNNILVNTEKNLKLYDEQQQIIIKNQTENIFKMLKEKTSINLNEILTPEKIKELEILTLYISNIIRSGKGNKKFIDPSLCVSQILMKLEKNNSQEGGGRITIYRILDIILIVWVVFLIIEISMDQMMQFSDGDIEWWSCIGGQMMQYAMYMYPDHKFIKGFKYDNLNNKVPLYINDNDGMNAADWNNAARIFYIKGPQELALRNEVPTDRSWWEWAAGNNYNRNLIINEQQDRMGGSIVDPENPKIKMVLVSILGLTLALGALNYVTHKKSKEDVVQLFNRLLKNIDFSITGYYGFFKAQNYMIKNEEKQNEVKECFIADILYKYLYNTKIEVDEFNVDENTKSYLYQMIQSSKKDASEPDPINTINYYLNVEKKIPELPEKFKEFLQTYKEKILPFKGNIKYYLDTENTENTSYKFNKINGIESLESFSINEMTGLEPIIIKTLIVWLYACLIEKKMNNDNKGNSNTEDLLELNEIKEDTIIMSQTYEIITSIFNIENERLKTIYENKDIILLPIKEDIKGDYNFDYLIFNAFRLFKDTIVPELIKFEDGKFQVDNNENNEIIEVRNKLCYPILHVLFDLDTLIYKSVTIPVCISPFLPSIESKSSTFFNFPQNKELNLLRLVSSEFEEEVNINDNIMVCKKLLKSLSDFIVNKKSDVIKFVNDIQNEGNSNEAKNDVGIASKVEIIKLRIDDFYKYLENNNNFDEMNDYCERFYKIIFWFLLIIKSMLNDKLADSWWFLDWNKGRNLITLLGESDNINTILRIIINQFVNQNTNDNEVKEYITKRIDNDFVNNFSYMLTCVGSVPRKKDQIKTYLISIQKKITEKFSNINEGDNILNEGIKTLLVKNEETNLINYMTHQNEIVYTTWRKNIVGSKNNFDYNITLVNICSFYIQYGIFIMLSKILQVSGPQSLFFLNSLKEISKWTNLEDVYNESEALVNKYFSNDPSFNEEMRNKIKDIISKRNAEIKKRQKILMDFRENQAEYNKTIVRGVAVSTAAAITLGAAVWVGGASLPVIGTQMLVKAAQTGVPILLTAYAKRQNLDQETYNALSATSKAVLDIAENAAETQLKKDMEIIKEKKEKEAIVNEMATEYKITEEEARKRYNLYTEVQAAAKLEQYDKQIKDGIITDAIIKKYKDRIDNTNNSKVDSIIKGYLKNLTFDQLLQDKQPKSNDITNLNNLIRANVDKPDNYNQTDIMNKFKTNSWYSRNITNSRALSSEEKSEIAKKIEAEMPNFTRDVQGWAPNPTEGEKIILIELVKYGDNLIQNIIKLKEEQKKADEEMAKNLVQANANTEPSIPLSNPVIGSNVDNEKKEQMIEALWNSMEKDSEKLGITKSTFRDTLKNKMANKNYDTWVKDVKVLSNNHLISGFGTEKQQFDDVKIYNDELKKLITNNTSTLGGIGKKQKQRKQTKRTYKKHKKQRKVKTMKKYKKKRNNSRRKK